MATNDPRPRRKSTIRNLSRGGGVFPVRDVSSKGRLPRGGLGSTSVTGKGPAKGVKPRMKMDPLT